MTTTTGGSAVVPDLAAETGLTRIDRFLSDQRPPTPCLVVDLPTVRERYAAVAAALPGVELFYAVKANPAPEVVRALAELGCSFDVASPAEIDLCLAQGADPAVISYSNPIKKAADIAHAHRVGVRLYAFDSEQDVRTLAEHAPGASVYCRVLVPDEGSTYSFGRKFGCEPEMAVDLLLLAAELGLDACGVSFHVGSQQLDPHGWDGGIACAARIAAATRAAGLELTTVNLGGGLPATYREPVPPLSVYGAALRHALAEHVPGVRVMLEPGRALVAEAGVLRSEVVLVSRKSYRDDRRWVYLDVGRYGGLAETEGEAIAYPLRTSRDGGPTGPVVVAGPSCDGDDVLYQRTVYHLPLDLRAGDQVDLLVTGAYTASYASVAFNGFPPLETYCIDDSWE